MRLAMLPITLFLMFILAGCNSIQQLTGTCPVPILSSTPMPSDCIDVRSKALDEIEASGYELARQGKIKWVKFVDDYYQKRAELYPNIRHDDEYFGGNEYKSYQKVLAEQLDLGKISEAVWVYQLESKLAEIRTRNEALANTVHRKTKCTTRKSGSDYETTCN